jgi:hypothetical protein
MKITSSKHHIHLCGDCGQCSSLTMSGSFHKTFKIAYVRDCAFHLFYRRCNIRDLQVVRLCLGPSRGGGGGLLNFWWVIFLCVSFTKQNLPMLHQLPSPGMLTLCTICFNIRKSSFCAQKVFLCCTHFLSERRLFHRTALTGWSL